MYGCQSRTIKKAEHQRSDAFALWWSLEKTLESPLDCKEIQPINRKGNQSWIFIGRIDAEAEAEAPVLCPPDVKNWLIGKDPDVEKDWGQEERGMTEDEMVGWHHLLSWHGFKQTSQVDDGQGSLGGSLQSIGVTKSWTWLSSWTELYWTELWCYLLWRSSDYYTLI